MRGFIELCRIKRKDCAASARKRLCKSSMINTWVVR